MAGESETSLKASGIDYVVGTASYGDNARGQIIGDFDGFLKLLFRADDMKLVGVHAVGEIASEVVHVGFGMMTWMPPTKFSYVLALTTQRSWRVVQVRHVRCDVLTNGVNVKPPRQVQVNGLARLVLIT